MELGSKNFFEIQKRNLDKLGITLNAEKKLQIAMKTIFLTVMIVLISIGLVYGAFENMSSLDKFCQALAPFMQTTLAEVKIFTFMLRRSSLSKLLQQLWSLKQKATDKELEIIITENKIDTKIARIYTITATSTAFFAAMVPIIVITANYIQTGQFEYVLTFEGNFYFDTSKFWNYCIVYICQHITLYVTLFSTVSFDSLFIWYIQNIVAHLLIVQEKLKFLYKSERYNSRETEQAIRLVIIHHDTAIAMADKFNEIYKPIIFAEFSLGSLQICLIAFQLVIGVEWVHVPFLVAFLSLVLVQMTMYCFGGERLENVSADLATKFYEAIQWGNSGNKSRKLLLLSMIRAQKPCTISAVFFQAKISLVLDVVKTASSYITLMKSLEENS